MATHTIGTGGDFSTVQAWEDDIPTTLTEQRIGQVLNEELTNSSGSVVAFSAHTLTASFNIILEAASGASFRDHANVRTNPLRYDASKGAALRTTSGTNEPVINADAAGASDARIIIRNLQLKNDLESGSTTGMRASQSHFRLDNVIFESVRVFDLYSDGGGSIDANNCLFVSRGSSIIFQKTINKNSGGAPWNLIGCTLVRPSNLGTDGTGFGPIYADGGTAKNCLFFGYTTDVQNLVAADTDYNGTSFSDAGSGLPDNTPDHNVYDVTYDDTLFVEPSDSGDGHDFRTLAGSAIENAGIYDGTNSPEDITGTTRSNPPEIGAWELSAAVQIVPAFLSPLRSNLVWS